MTTEPGTVPWLIEPAALESIAGHLRRAGCPDPVLFIGERVGNLPVRIPTGRPATVVLCGDPAGMDAAAADTLPHLDAGSRACALDWAPAAWTGHCRTDAVAGHAVQLLDEVGSCRPVAGFHESAIVAIAAPDYEGFLVAWLHARVDLPDLEVGPSRELEGCVSCHLADAPLLAGQRRGIDIELHPDAWPRDECVQGSVEARDPTGSVLARLQLTLARDPLVSCVAQAARPDGSRPERAAWLAAQSLAEGRMRPRAAAAAIQRANLATLLGSGRLGSLWRRLRRRRQGR